MNDLFLKLALSAGQKTAAITAAKFGTATASMIGSHYAVKAARKAYKKKIHVSEEFDPETERREELKCLLRDTMITAGIGAGTTAVYTIIRRTVEKAGEAAIAALL